MREATRVWAAWVAGLLAACGDPGDATDLALPLPAGSGGPGVAPAGSSVEPAGAPGLPTNGGAGAPLGSEPTAAPTPETSPAGAAGPSSSTGSPPSAPPPETATTADPAPGDTVFAEGQVLEVRLTILAADVAELDEHGNREEYVPAQVRLTRSGGASEQLPEIGVRHKGNWTLHHCWDDFEGVRSYEGECAKLSLKLEFDEYVPDARFDGLKRLNLHASTGDASRLRELLAYATFRAFGVDAPRAVPARVYVNDEPRGLFIAVENVDGRYTSAHFPSAPDGNLYKEIWPDASFEDEELAQALETNEELADVRDMRALAEAVARSTPETFADEVEPLIDVEALARYLAVDRAIRNWDGITSFYDPRTPHNFYWYDDGVQSPHFRLIPWDLDDTYWPYDPYVAPEPPVSAPPIPNINVRPAHCEPRPIWRADGSAGYVTPGRCNALLDAFVTRHWSDVVELGAQLLEGPFSPDVQSALVDAWAASVAPIVEDDPLLELGAWESSVTDLHGVIERSASSFHALLAEGLQDEPTSSESTVED